MLEAQGFIEREPLTDGMLQSWIQVGWLQPTAQNGTVIFAEIDIARAQLIDDLIHDLGVNDQGVSVALNLIDQIHGLRRAFRALHAVQLNR